MLKNAANGQYISTKWQRYLPFTLADFPDSTKAAVNKKQLTVHIQSVHILCM